MTVTDVIDDINSPQSVGNSSENHQKSHLFLTELGVVFSHPAGFIVHTRVVTGL